MHRHIAVAALLLLAACGMSEGKFLKKVVDVACAACEGEDAFECAAFEESWTGLEGCEYDPKAAKECAKGEWTCNTNTPPIVFPDRPSACDKVYECPESSE
jgi:hypothetical protein